MVSWRSEPSIHPRGQAFHASWRSEPSMHPGGRSLPCILEVKPSTHPGDDDDGDGGDRDDDDDRPIQKISLNTTGVLPLMVVVMMTMMMMVTVILMATVKRIMLCSFVYKRHRTAHISKNTRCRWAWPPQQPRWSKKTRN